jgi:hypothetical protein
MTIQRRLPTISRPQSRVSPSFGGMVACPIFAIPFSPIAAQSWQRQLANWALADARIRAAAAITRVHRHASEPRWN